MDKPLAVRTLITPDGAPPVRLELGHPTQTPGEDEEWSCPLRIVQGEQVVVQDEGFGSDALQALVNAIAGLRWHFDRSGLTAAWFHDQPGTGLPLYLARGLGPEFEAHLQGLVDAEVARRAREREGKTPGPEGESSD
jgi:hypothetical protein